MLKLKFWPIVNLRFQATLLGLIFGFLAYQSYLEGYQILKTEVNSWTEDLAADCAVVLTGGPQRVREGFDLLANHRVKKLIISGVHPRAQLREIMPNILFYGEINEKDIILERKSGTTYGNAQQSLVISEAAGCRDILLVTSKWHMHRAYKTFRAIFPENIAIYKNAVYGGLQKNVYFEVGWEIFKTLFYKLWVF